MRMAVDTATRRPTTAPSSRPSTSPTRLSASSAGRCCNCICNATSVHPGAVGDTAIGRHVSPEFRARIMADPYVRKILKSPEQGAATTVWAAVGREWTARGGRYLEDVAEARRGEDDGLVFGVGWVRQTYNPEEEDRLWEESLRMVGLAE
ncbi:uncharacterized protein B0T15DRAFT_419209 [Chaetomium strumarium]|uniref:Uncharacterized protein n=1 Tax=Chaetomium strumarium TaxID=1170767 RepID=A0AAJ0GRX2_9PEZI|nr:hypothetical protein B0T15DRAFT_419209 [Chaetomium strumarium]